MNTVLPINFPVLQSPATWRNSRLFMEYRAWKFSALIGWVVMFIFIYIYRERERWVLVTNIEHSHFEIINYASSNYMPTLLVSHFKMASTYMEICKMYCLFVVSLFLNFTHNFFGGKNWISLFLLTMGWQQFTGLHWPPCLAQWTLSLYIYMEC